MLPSETNSRQLLSRDETLEIIESARNLTWLCHRQAKRAGWWTDLNNGADQTIQFNVPEKLMLIVSELGEAMEGHRKKLFDEHLTDRMSVEVELADAVIRIFDLAGAKGYDLPGAISEKMLYNERRSDHLIENRLKPGGKAY